jgi:23S rRNA pseudouridine1911/1915/1917 synthase
MPNWKNSSSNPSGSTPSPLPRIVADWGEVVAVEKPAGWLVHPTRPDGAFTLRDWLLQIEASPFLAPIHRLDRETSGLVIFARSSEAASVLGRAFMARSHVIKEYLAIVRGTPLRDKFQICWNLDAARRHGPAKVYIKQIPLPTDSGLGYPAQTEVWTLDRVPGFSLLRVRPHTGRLHQIRVHLAAELFPLAGDKIYGPDESCYLEFIEKGWTPTLEQRLILPRHALHAASLTFPWRGGELHASSPLPQDLQSFWDSLRSLRSQVRRPVAGTPNLPRHS